MPVVRAEKLGFFRYLRLGEKVLLTNDAGQYHFLIPADFDALLRGEITPRHNEYERLRDLGFVREGLDLDAIAARIRRKKAYLGQGPHLAVVITTLRCNQSCNYCHASRADMDRVDTDMSIETAKAVVDHAMQTPSPYLNFEFQGGEPTVNFDVIRFVVAYSREKNRYEGKQLDHSVVTNMTTMTDEVADWLVDNGVLICTSLDGPEDVHNYNRGWMGGGNAHAAVISWMRSINQRYVDKGLDPELWHVDALMTTTRKTLGRANDLIDLYLELGIRNIHLRPLNPFGFATRTWRAVGYTMTEFLAFYEEALDRIIALNREGVQVIEGTAAVLLSKILNPADPNFVDIRSPVGSGTGQIAYNYDGSIYPSDEGRMVAAMGDEMFRLGTVFETSFNEATQHPTVKSLAVASTLDTLPMCSDCWNAPYCGVRPMHNYMLTGDLFGQRPNTPKCQQHMAIARMLFERLACDDSGELETIFRRWTVNRPRTTDSLAQEQVAE